MEGERGATASILCCVRTGSHHALRIARDAVTGEAAGVILNVSDDPATRQRLSRTLRQAGYEIQEASSGHEALALARQAPRLIVLDVELPDLDGLEVCRRLKAHPLTAAIPVLQMSRDDEDAGRVGAALESGADGYLVQPITPAELIATVRALLRLRETEASLEGAGLEWQQTFDALADAAAILGAQGEILRANRALLGVVRASSDDIIGRPVHDVLREHLGIEHPVLEPSAMGDAGRRSSERQAGDRWYRLVTEPIVDEHGHASRFVLVMTDITRLRHLEEAERRRADERLEDTSRKDEFLAMLAHELRNPLNAIAAATALQAQGDAGDEQRTQVSAAVSRQIQHLSRLVDELLDVSRLTRGRVRLQTELLDLRAVVQDVAQMAGPDLEARHQPLVLELPDAPVMVQGDSLRLGQALSNLVANASKFSDASRPIHLRCTLDRQDAAHPMATVRVVDEGIGIDPTRLDSIFEPFVQGQTSLARSDGGLGVGLTIARRMVELHDGALTAASAGVGTGTEFRLTLPLAANAGDAAARPTAIDAAPAIPQALTALDVLIVEDDADAAELMRALFEALGHSTRVARDGVAGLSEVLAQPPDVAFIDIGLPRMDGYAVARTIRRSDQGADVYLVALTGYGRPVDRARALVAGFDVHLVKPLEIDRVNELLKDRPHRPLPRSPEREPDWH